MGPEEPSDPGRPSQNDPQSCPGPSGWPTSSAPAIIGCVRMVRSSAILSLLFLMGACGAGETTDPSAASTTASNPTGGAVYLARSDDQWVVKEANNSLPENTLTRVVEPSLDWYAEYEAPPRNSPRRVRLSGHGGDLDHVAGELKGFTFEPATVDAYRALSAVSPEPNGRPAVVLLALRADFSVMALSYELPIQDLLAWSDDLMIVTESEWVRAGGVVDR